MRRLLFTGLIVFMGSICLSLKANAETLILQSGQKIEGHIIERTELRVIVDVQGTPETFYLAEIASINGKPVEMPQDKAVEKALNEANKPLETPVNNEEQKSLVSFMDTRKSDATAINNSMDHKSPASSTPLQKTPQSPEKLEDLVHSMHDMMGKMADANKNVVSTSDGGIIVVGPEKIIKYDKNLNVIKEINLNSDNPAVSK